MVYQTADLLSAMKADGAVIENLQIDGGMVNNHWFCQFLADVLDLQVMRPLQTETTAFGVALLAGIQLQWYADLAALPSLVRAESWCRPKMNDQTRAQLLTEWHHEVQRLLAASH